MKISVFFAREGTSLLKFLTIILMEADASDALGFLFFIVNPEPVFALIID